MFYRTSGRSAGLFYGVLNILAFVMTSLTEADCGLFLYGFQSLSLARVGVCRLSLPTHCPSPGRSLSPINNRFPASTSPVWWRSTPQWVRRWPSPPCCSTAPGTSSLSATWWRSNWSAPCLNMGWPPVRRPFRRDVQLSAAVGLSSLTLMGWILFWGAGGLLRRGDAPAEVLPSALKAWKGAVPLAAAIVFLSLSVHYGWYGFESRVPDPARSPGSRWTAFKAPLR